MTRTGRILLTAGAAAGLATLYLTVGMPGGGESTSPETPSTTTSDSGHDAADGAASSQGDPSAPADSGEAGTEDADKEQLNAAYDDLNDNTDYPSLDHRLQEMRARRGGRDFQAENVIASMRVSDAWETTDEPGDNLKLSDEERHDGRDFVRFRAEKLETLVPGDTMTIPLDQKNQEYTMAVNRVEVHGDGNVTWHGRLTEFPDNNQVSITRGESLTVGGFTTPEGHYTLQARGNQGWVASSDTLFKRDPNQTDAVVPDTEQPQKDSRNPE